MEAFLNYLINAIALGATFLYGSTGEILTEKAGHLNLGIPGILCVGGAGGCAALYALYGPYKAGMPGFLVVIIALLATFLSGAVMGAIYSFLTVTLKANQNVTGLAMTTFGSGLMTVIMLQYKASYTKYLYATELFRFPFSGQNNSLQYCGVMFFLAIIIALIASYVLTRTRTGLHLRAVGENPATADAAGINVTAYKYGATCIGSGIAALGGLFYIIDYSGSGEAYKSIEPFGWLSIALVIFALWRPHLSIFGSALFGLLFVAGTAITGMVPGLPMYLTPIFKMLPYVVTVVVLVISSIRKKRENQPPASLGLPYFREER